MLSNVMERSEAVRAICTWAYEGAVPSRAKLLREGEDAKADAAIAFEFWRSRGGEGLTQDWSLGNFETWVRHIYNDGVRLYGDVYYQAYGVEFERGALEDMLPPHLKPAKSKRGRPMAYDWPSAVEEVRDQIERKVLKPMSQADVERALMTALGQRDKYPAKSTFQRYAEPIWQDYGPTHNV